MCKTILIIVVLGFQLNAETTSIQDVYDNARKNKKHFTCILDAIKPVHKDEIVPVLEGNGPKTNGGGFSFQFIRLFKGTVKFGNCIDYMIKDSIFVLPMAKMLCLGEGFEGVTRYAVESLIDDPSFPALYALTDSIKPYVKCLPDHNKRKHILLSFLNLTEDEKKHILEDVHPNVVTLSVRARLGDKEAEKKLIDGYLKAHGYWEKSRFAESLIQIGTEECLKTLIKKFNEPVFRKAGNCIDRSIRYPIVRGFRRYHPGLPLFREKFTEVDTVRFQMRHQDEIKHYMDEFVQWAHEEYGVMPDDTAPKPYIFEGFCIRR